MSTANPGCQDDVSRDGAAIVCANGKTVFQVASEWMDAAARCDIEAIVAGMAADWLAELWWPPR